MALLVPRQRSFVTPCGALIGLVTPCAPFAKQCAGSGAHGVTRPTFEGPRLGALAAAVCGALVRTSSAGRGVWRWTLGALLVFWPSAAFAQVVRAPEYSLKAAYLFNFTQFIEWPSNSFISTDAPIVIGVLGEDPFGGALDQAIKGKAVHGRSLELKRFKQIGEMRGCHVLFVCASEAARLPEIFLAAQKGGILTVSDIDRFAERGGIINFYKENNKVRFKINLNAAERAGTKISSQLLRLGTIVREEIDAEK